MDSGSACHADISVSLNNSRKDDSVNLGEVVSLIDSEGTSIQNTSEMKSESKSVGEIQCTVNGGDEVENTRTTNDANGTVEMEEDGAGENNSSNLMLGLLDEFTKIYKDKLERLENSALKMEDQNYMQEKVRLLESWLGELGEQNAVLVGTVAELEREAGTRVTLLQGALGTMAPTTRDTCKGFRDHQLQVRQVVEGRLAAEDELERLRDHLTRVQDSCRHLSTENANLHTDIDSLLDVLTRARVTGVWRCDDVSFLCITAEQVFGPVPPQSGASTPSLRSCMFLSSPPSSLPPSSDQLHHHRGSGTASSLTSAGQVYGGCMDGAGEAPWLCDGRCGEGGAAALKELRLLREARDRTNSLLVLRDKRIADLQCQLADLQQLHQEQQDLQLEQRASARTNGHSSHSDSDKLALCWRPPAIEGEKTDSMHSSVTEGEPLPTDMQVEQQLAANIDVLASRLAEAEADSEAAREHERVLRADGDRLQGLLREAADERTASQAVIDNLERRLHESEREAKQLKLQLFNQMASQQKSQLLPEPQQQNDATTTTSDTVTREVACMTAPTSSAPASPALASPALASPALASPAAVDQHAWQSHLQLSRLENEVSEKGILIRELQGHLATARHECHLKDETLDKVERKLQTLRAELVEREERREYLEQQLVSLQRQLAIEHAHKQDFAAQVTSKGDLLRKLERENWSLAGQLNAKTAGADTLQLTADHVAGELINRDREVMEQRLTIASLQEALVATKQTCDVLRARLDEDFEESRQEIDFLRRENSSVLNQLENLRNDISSASLRENEMHQKISALKYHQTNMLRDASNNQRQDMWLPTPTTTNQSEQFCEEDEYNYDDEVEQLDQNTSRNEKEQPRAYNLRSCTQTFPHQRAASKNILRNGQTLPGNQKPNIMRRNEPCERQSAGCQLPTANTSEEHQFRNIAGNKTTNRTEGSKMQEGGMTLGAAGGVKGQQTGVRGQHVRWQQEEEEDDGPRPPLGWIPVPRRGTTDSTPNDGGQKLSRSAELWEAQRALVEAQQERSHAHEQVLSLLRECNTLEEQIQELMLENNRLTEESSSRAAQLDEGRRQMVADQLAARQAKEETDRLRRAMEQANEECVRLRKEFQAKCDELEQGQQTWAGKEVGPGSSSAKNARHASGRPDEETEAILPREGEASVHGQAIGTPHIQKNFPPRDRLDEKPPLPPQQINDADGRHLRRKTSHGNRNLEGEPSGDDHSAEGCRSTQRKQMVSVGTSTEDDFELPHSTETEQSLVKCGEFSDPVMPLTSEGCDTIPTNDGSSLVDEGIRSDNKPEKNEVQLDSSSVVSPSVGNLCSSFKENSSGKKASLSDQHHSTSEATLDDILPGKPTAISSSESITGEIEKRRGETALSPEDDRLRMPLELGDASRPTLEQEMEWTNKLAAIRGECERVLAEGLVLKESNTKLKEQVSTLEGVVSSLRAQQQTAADTLEEALLEREELATAVAVVVGGLRSWANEVSGQLAVWAEAQDGPSKHLMLLHTEKRVLAERNAALQRVNTELRHLLRSVESDRGLQVTSGATSSLIHQPQTGQRTRNSSGYSLTSYDFSDLRDSGVHDDIVVSGGSEASNHETRKEDDDSARGSTHSSNVSCGSLEEHVLNVNQEGQNSDQHVLLNLDQLASNVTENFDLDLINFTEDEKPLATAGTDLSEGSSTPDNKDSPPSLRRLRRNGSSPVMLRSELLWLVQKELPFLTGKSRLCWLPCSTTPCNGLNNIDWGASTGAIDQPTQPPPCQGPVKSKKAFSEYRQDLERLITIANSLLKSTRRILRASRVDAAPRLRCSASLQDLRDGCKPGPRVRSFSASRAKKFADDSFTASKERLESSSNARNEFQIANSRNESFTSPDGLISSKARGRSGLSITSTPSGGGISPYYSDDLCDTCRMKNMEKAVASLSNRLDGGSSYPPRLSSLGTITEGNNNSINIANPEKNSQFSSMAKELQEIQAIIQTNASLVTSIRSLTQGSPLDLDLAWSVESETEQVTQAEEFHDSGKLDDEDQYSRRTSFLSSKTSCDIDKDVDKEDGNQQNRSVTYNLLNDLDEENNACESELPCKNLVDEDSCENDLTENICLSLGDKVHILNDPASDIGVHCDKSVNAHQQNQKQLTSDETSKQTHQPSHAKGLLLIDGEKRVQSRSRRRGKGSFTTLL